MKKGLWIGAILALVVVAVIIYDIRTQNPAAHPLIELAKGELSYTVLVIDADRDHQISDSSILSGNDSPLLVLRQVQEDKQQYDTIEKIDELFSFDQNGDGRLDLNDPKFQELGLLSMSQQGNRRDIVPLSESSIRMIRLNREILSHAAKDPSWAKNQVVGEALLGDGSYLPIRFSSVSRSVLYPK